MSAYVPRLLPPDLDGFLNRQDEIDAVVKALDAGRASGPVLLWLTGFSGIGKTALAVHLGHLLAERFEDGQLYYDLRGSGPGKPAAVTDVLAYFLGKFGKSPDEIPATEEERAADFRSITSGKQVLIILDDAHTAGQVRALLPSTSGSAVIVTSRKHLDGLVLAKFVNVEVTEFDADLAEQLVSQLVDSQRLTAEPDAVALLLGLCAGLPLALLVAAARISTKPRKSLADLVAQITAAPFAHLRLDGEAPVERVFDASFDELDAVQQRAFRLLGRYPGPHFRAPILAAMLDVSDDEAEDLLDDLTKAYLVRRCHSDAYQFHSLTGEYARVRSAELAPRDIDAALRRMVAAQDRRAFALGTSFSPRWTVGHLTGDVKPAFTGPDARQRAHTELELDEAGLSAAIRVAADLGMDQETASMCEALKPWQYDTDRVGAMLDTLSVGVPAADRLGGRLAMRLHHDRGSAYEKAGDFVLAQDDFVLSRRLSVGDPMGEASAVEAFGLVCRQLGEHEQALNSYREAWSILDQVGDQTRVERARVLLRMHIGTELTLTDDMADAADHLTHARSWFAARGESVNEARTIGALGVVARRVGQSDQAVELFELAIAKFTDAGLRSKQADTLRLLADVEAAQGDRQSATTHRHAARDLYEQLGQWKLVVEVEAEIRTE